MLKITGSQYRALSRLAREKDDLMRIWGAGFGITRPSVRVLQRLGLAEYDETEQRGICCRITPQGRIALAQAVSTIRRRNTGD